MSQEKFNYIVSDHGLVGLGSEEKFFFHSHVCAYENGFNYKDSNVADFPDQKKEQIDAGWIFVEDRYEKYIKLFSHRLNLIHETEYSIEFWRRAFSLNLLRNISAIHMFFVIAERHFDPSLHACKILPKNKYKYCNDFEQQRGVLTSSWIGQEQLLSLYIELFYPSYYKSLDDSGCFLDISDAGLSLESTNDSKIISFMVKLKRNINNIIRPSFLLSYFYRKIESRFSRKNIVIGILGSFFSQKYFDVLERNSKGRIRSIPIVSGEEISETNLDMRSRLLAVNPDADRFDRFFFFTSLYFFPKVLLEGFQSALWQYDRILDDLPSLKYIVSEAWLGSTSINLFRALSYELRNIKTLYNEHNCIFHPFLDDFVEFQSKMVDLYMTFGWKSSSRKFLSLSSLYPFAIEKEDVNYEILYVSYPAEQCRAIYSSSYSQAGYGAISHLNFVGNFFATLPVDILNRISYRGYPKDYFILGLRYDKEEMLDPYLQHVTFVSSSKTVGETCKQQMAASRLVVIDYLSTAYLESLMMNIPTICFWDAEVMCLKNEYSDFYDDLIEAKIIHTSPESASRHLLDVYEDPSIWWNDPSTQMLRKRWLSRNFGEPELLVNYLLGLSH